MSKVNPKQIAASIPGIGARVINRDLNSAIRTWKIQYKNAEIIDQLRERKQFTKKSFVRRQEIKAAMYKQKFDTARSK
jgi:ribosomal protein S21